MSITWHQCDQCEYKTEIKANLTRHVNLKHSTVERIKCSYCDKTFTTIPNCKRHMVNSCSCSPKVAESTILAPEVADSAPKVAKSALLAPEVADFAPEVAKSATFAPDVADDVMDTESGHKCITCQRLFSNQRNLVRHYGICKGTQNTLECHLCHHVFANKYAKSRHLKGGCLAVVLHEERLINIGTQNTSVLEPVSSINNVNGIQNNIQTQNNIENKNNINNNITIIFPGDQHMQFITEHITAEKIAELMKKDDKAETLSSYTRNLMENKRNICVEKTNMRSVHSSVHVGNNQWETRHDKEVYPKVVASLANSFIDILNGRKPEMKLGPREARYFQNMIKFLDYMADNGYTADEDNAKDVKAEHKSLIQRHKGIFHDVTKTKKCLR